MGRSGTGIVGAGPISSGGGGISRLPGSSSSSSSYHSSSSSSSWWYYSYGGRQRVNCNLCAIPIMFMIFVAMIVLVLLADGALSVKKGLAPCEQVIVCPNSLRDGVIKFTTKASGTTTATLVKKVPAISSIIATKNYKPEDDEVAYGHYALNSFNLVTKSVIHWHVVPVWRYLLADYDIIFYLVKGEENYNKASYGKDFPYLKMKSLSDTSKPYDDSFTVEEADEYFLLVAGNNPGSKSCFEANYTVDFTHFLVDEEAIQNCSSSCTFKVSNHDFPPQCIVVENPCDSEVSNDDIVISYEAAHSGLFYGCLVVAILGGIGMVGAIVACVVCAMRKNKGTQGQSYQTIPSNPAVPAPVPVGYQQPQPAYVQPQPAYTAGVPPNYAYGTAAPVTF